MRSVCMVRKASPKELSYTTEDGEKYVIKVPTGALGWKHFRILMEVENERKNTIREIRVDTRPTITEWHEDPKKEGEYIQVTIENPTFNKEIEVELPNPKLDEVMSIALDKWMSDILPHIVVSHEFDDIPWSVLLALFQCATQNASIDANNFRGDQ